VTTCARSQLGLYRYLPALGFSVHVKLLCRSVSCRLENAKNIKYETFIKNTAPQSELFCLSVFDAASRHYLWSASRRLLVIPRYTGWVHVWPTGFLSLYGWSVGLQLLLDILHNPDISRDSFIRLFKVQLFSTYWSVHRIRCSAIMCYINLHFTYLLTCLLAYACGVKITKFGFLLKTSALETLKTRLMMDYILHIQSRRDQGWKNLGFW